MAQTLPLVVNEVDARAHDALDRSQVIPTQTIRPVYYCKPVLSARILHHSRSSGGQTAGCKPIEVSLLLEATGLRIL
jgi:hypothetical protein